MENMKAHYEGIRDEAVCPMESEPDDADGACRFHVVHGCLLPAVPVYECLEGSDNKADPMLSCF